MKSSAKFQPAPSSFNVIARLVLLGGLVLGSMYVVLLAFAGLTKVL